jgi:hypothetical protein
MCKAILPQWEAHAALSKTTVFAMSRPELHTAQLKLGALITYVERGVNL